MMAVCEGHLKTTILLLENGSDVTATDADQNGILLLAVQNHKEDLVPLLLDNQVLAPNSVLQPELCPLT